MGGANGFSVLRRFKEELPQTKVVLMTGHGSAAGALDATAYGAYDYLLKPFGVEALQSLSQAMRERLLHTPRHRGTVFLDEITETTPAFLVKLLRALQEGEVRRVGSNRTQQVDVRVVAACNRDVEGEVKAGRFVRICFIV
jgi:DNA-binding NtrC family response regulator